jgi:hypothetical protein
MVLRVVAGDGAGEVGSPQRVDAALCGGETSVAAGCE